MSYILDALRKAEAERERGSVPGIHAQPGFAGARPSGSPARSRMWIVVLALGAALAIAIAVALYLLFGRSANGDVATPVAKLPMPAPTLPAPPVATAPPVALPAPAPMPTAVAVAPPVQAAAPLPAPAARKPRPPAPAASSASAAAPGPVGPKAEERIYAISELPDDIRRQLPQLSVGGSMYSPTAASRLVIINGQVLHEGEHITPELAVQQIGPKAAVLAFKGYRYTLAF